MCMGTHVIVIFKLVAVLNTLVLLPAESFRGKFLPICH